VTSEIAENRFVPDCFGVVTACAFVSVNLLTERFEMPVYYYNSPLETWGSSLTLSDLHKNRPVKQKPKRYRHDILH